MDNLPSGIFSYITENNIEGISYIDHHMYIWKSPREIKSLEDITIKQTYDLNLNKIALDELKNKNEILHKINHFLTENRIFILILQDSINDLNVQMILEYISRGFRQQEYEESEFCITIDQQNHTIHTSISTNLQQEIYSRGYKLKYFEFKDKSNRFLSCINIEDVTAGISLINELIQIWSVLPKKFVSEKENTSKNNVDDYNETMEKIISSEEFSVSEKLKLLEMIFKSKEKE